ncbi:MAG: channel [Candidatus Peregrinibacteria bacterium GW2011_GWF2_39_17]|nr:MAG: channel [Candidatus Peregrinibacteria bacterium GW2011_GWF2_39_17]HCW32016.1 hypothetical protein [Candidatus Peregrinibacteria bacterium]
MSRLESHSYHGKEYKKPKINWVKMNPEEREEVYRSYREAFAGELSQERLNLAQGIFKEVASPEHDYAIERKGISVSKMLLEAFKKGKRGSESPTSKQMMFFCLDYLSNNPENKDTVGDITLIYPADTLSVYLEAGRWKLKVVGQKGEKRIDGYLFPSNKDESSEKGKDTKKSDKSGRKVEKKGSSGEKGQEGIRKEGEKETGEKPEIDEQPGKEEKSSQATESEKEGEENEQAGGAEERNRENAEDESTKSQENPESEDREVEVLAPRAWYYEISPPLEGNYTTTVYSLYNGREWEIDEISLSDYAFGEGLEDIHTLSGKARQEIIIPLPEGYRIKSDSITTNPGTTVIVKQDQYGIAHLIFGSALPVEYSLEFSKDETYQENTPPSSVETEDILRGAPLQEDTQALVDELGRRDDLSPLEKAQKIKEFIVEQFFYSKDASVSEYYHENGSREFMKRLDQTRKADCDVANTFFVALCREIGIPARRLGGYGAIPHDGKTILTGGDGRHGWAEIWEGTQWISMDATPTKRLEEGIPSSPEYDEGSRGSVIPPGESTRVKPEMGEKTEPSLGEIIPGEQVRFGSPEDRQVREMLEKLPTHQRGPVGEFNVLTDCGLDRKASPPKAYIAYRHATLKYYNTQNPDKPLAVMKQDWYVQKEDGLFHYEGSEYFPSNKGYDSVASAEEVNQFFRPRNVQFAD